MKFLRFFFLIAGMSLASGLEAQDDWREGYVVTSDGDTLRGEVRDRDSGSFPSLFRKVQIRTGRKKRKFTPQRLMSYQWGNKTFVTLQVASTSRFLRTDTRVVPSGGEYRFYQLAADGPLQLYYEEFVDDDASMIESVPFFKRRGDPRLVRATQGIFGLKKKLLASFFADRPDLVEGIQQGRLKTPMDVVEAY